jgi:hypothetical protein
MTHTTKTKGKGRKKKGVAGNKASRSHHLRVVEDMLAAGYPMPAVVTACVEEFGCVEKTVYVWAREVEDRWQEMEDVERPKRRARHRARLDALYRRAWDEGDLLVCVQAAKLQAAIDGLNAPTKLEVSGSVSVMALTTEQRRAEIAKLLERRQAALAAAARPPLPPGPVIDVEAAEASP